MTATDPLFAGVLADPRDDTIRLVYADWLDEAGDHARAEFVRVQVALANTPEEDPGRDTLAERERQLLHAHGERWRGALPQIPHVHWGEFARGFVHEVKLHELVEEDLYDDPGRDFPDGCRVHAVVSRESLAAAFAAAPVRRLAVSIQHGTSIRRAAEALDLTGVSELALGGRFDADELLAWLASPRSAHLSTLGLCPRLPDDDLRRLIASPLMARLRTLDLQSVPAGTSLAEAVATAPALGNLEILRFGDSGNQEGERVGDAGARALAASPHLNRLRELTLNNSRVTGDGVQALADSPAFASLLHLCLRGNRIGRAGEEALATSASLRRLVHLDLSLCDLTAEGLKALATSPALAAVRSLNLGGNRLGEGVAPALTAGVWNLTRLDLIGVHLTADGAAAMAVAPCLAGVVSLNLMGNPTLGAAGVAAVVASPQWAGLRVLDLGHCEAGAGAEALAGSAGLNGLHTLDLSFNGLGDAGAAALAGWRGLEAVRELNLAYCEIGPAGAEALLASPWLRPGANLHLFGNFEIAEESISRLREKYGEGVWWSPRGSDDF